MPRYYCDYCDTYLTHDSPSVRKQHNAGYKHKANVRNYYQQFEEQQTQSLIDQKIKQHLSGQAAFGQIGAQYAAWRPGIRPPMVPILPIPGGVLPNAPMAPGIRVPVLQRPPGVPVYGAPPMAAPVLGQPGAPTVQVQTNGPPGPPATTASTSVPGAMPPGPSAAPATASQPMYPGMQGSFGGASLPAAPSFPSAGGNPAYPATSSADSFSYSQAPNNNH